MSQHWPRSRSILGNHQSEASLCNLGSERQGGTRTLFNGAMKGEYAQCFSEPKDRAVTHVPLQQ